jgi:uncharacterized protein (DUF488 family)
VVTEAPVEILTIGHSAMPYEHFLGLLHRSAATAVADVRTTPYSRRSPQFNRNRLRDELRRAGIAYLFFGEELGGRPADKRLYRDGVADYEKMATEPDFAEGLERIVGSAKHYRLAMMCAEQDPLDCHRFLLVGRALHQEGILVRHILPDGSVADHAVTEERLLRLSRRSDLDLFESGDRRLAAAYRDRASRVAYAWRDRRGRAAGQVPTT